MASPAHHFSISAFQFFSFFIGPLCSFVPLLLVTPPLQHFRFFFLSSVLRPLSSVLRFPHFSVSWPVRLGLSAFQLFHRPPLFLCYFVVNPPLQHFRFFFPSSVLCPLSSVLRFPHFRISAFQFFSFFIGPLCSFVPLLLVTPPLQHFPSVLCLLSSVLRLPSCVLRLPSCVLRPPSSVLRTIAPARGGD